MYQMGMELSGKSEQGAVARRTQGVHEGAAESPNSKNQRGVSWAHRAGWRAALSLQSRAPLRLERRGAAIGFPREEGACWPILSAGRRRTLCHAALTGEPARPGASADPHTCDNERWRCVSLPVVSGCLCGRWWCSARSAAERGSHRRAPAGFEGRPGSSVVSGGCRLLE